MLSNVLDIIINCIHSTDDARKGLKCRFPQFLLIELKKKRNDLIF